ncbi:MAG: c-type cytochrome [Candidatus Krumholzibacteriota bacterium]
MKFNTTIKVLLALMILTGLAATALAGDEPVKEVEKTKETKDMDGKELFIAYCKVCHTEDSDAGEYTPMSLIMDQWDEFFDETFVETHKEVACPKDKDQKITDMIDKDMIKKIRKFCVDHAADSEQPMTCG